MRRTVSIASAAGWKADFTDDAQPDGTRVVTLVAWALVETGGDVTEVVGLIQRAPTADSPAGRIGYADEVEGFWGYTFIGLSTRSLD